MAGQEIGEAATRNGVVVPGWGLHRAHLAFSYFHGDEFAELVCNFFEIIFAVGSMT